MVNYLYLSHCKISTENNMQPKVDDSTQWMVDKINKFDAVDCLLDYLCDKNDALMNGTTVSTALSQLTHLQYKDLRKLPWLQENMDLARLQLVISGRVEEFMGPITSHAGFVKLLDAVYQMSPKFDHIQVTSNLQLLTMLGVKLTDAAIQQCLLDSTRALDQFSINALAGFSVVFRSLPKGIRLTYIKPFLKRYTHLVGDIDSMQGVLDVTDIIKNSGFFMSKDLLSRSVKLIVNYLRVHGESVTDPTTITQIAYIGRRLYYARTVDIKFIKELLEFAKDAGIKVLDQFEPRHIGELCSSLKLSKFYKADVAVYFEQHSWKLLKSKDLRLCDISNLSYALTSNSSPEVRRIFTNAVYLNMDDIDVVVLSNLAETFYQMAMQNKDVIRRFQQLVLAHMERLIEYNTRLQLVLRFLTVHKFYDRQGEQSFSHCVINAIKKQKLMEMTMIPSVAAYFLKNTADPLPDVIYELLIAAIPKWKIGNLYRLIVGLNSLKQPMTSQLQKQLSVIHHALYLAMLDKLDDIRGIDHLVQLTQALSVHNRFDDCLLTEKLMKLYPRFTGDLDVVSAIKITHLFYALAFSHPQVYDDLVLFVIRHPNLKLDEASKILGACAQVGYAPKCFDKFVTSMLEKLDSGEGATVLQELRVLNNLSILNCFPEQQLRRVFCISYIELVDHYIEDNMRHQREVEQLMMELNRSVILDCPQLDVPWFHESYCENHNVMTRDASKDLCSRGDLREQVKECLEEVLGDQNYFREDTVTPYYNTIDYECALDSQNRPISMSNPDLHQIAERFAVVILTSHDFCYNSRRLIGQQVMRMRHLEMMGYRVAQVSYFDWYSMGLTDWDAKVEYLKSKIFPRYHVGGHSQQT